MSLPLIFITGPTSIGKSDLAIELAKKLNGEIINADSMQVYSNLSILTARPSTQELKIIPHHLYGYIEASNRYNVAKWCSDASKIIEKNKKRKIVSIIVGGTGMYIEKLLNGLVVMPSIPENIKKESEKLFINLGIDKFAIKVKKIDPNSYIKISSKDKNRIKRIWEVYKHTNKPLSYWQENKNKRYIENKNYKIFLFTPNRKEIYESVNSRFDKMIHNGAIDEVKNLLKLNLDSSLPVMRAHGVPEIKKYLDGLISIEECIDKGQQVTRNYVKRQLTWWRSSQLKIYAHLDQFPREIDVNSLKI